VSARSTQDGSVTLLGMGIVVMMLFVGGLAFDLWRLVGERRVLADAADAAAAAGANAIDVDGYRHDGRLDLDPALARATAAASLASQPDLASLTRVAVSAGPDVVVVRLDGRVELVLLDLFAPGQAVELRVEAQAAPRRGAADP
jgi:Flp pilus assembly protein TadG